MKGKKANRASQKEAKKKLGDLNYCRQLSAQMQKDLKGSAGGAGIGYAKLKSIQ